MIQVWYVYHTNIIPGLFYFFDFLVEKILSSMRIYAFCNIRDFMSANHLYRIFIHTGIFCNCYKSVSGIVRRKSRQFVIFHYFLETPSIFIISQWHSLILSWIFLTTNCLARLTGTICASTVKSYVRLSSISFFLLPYLSSFLKKGIYYFLLFNIDIYK